MHSEMDSVGLEWTSNKGCPLKVVNELRMALLYRYSEGNLRAPWSKSLISFLETDFWLQRPKLGILKESL